MNNSSGASAPMGDADGVLNSINRVGLGYGIAIAVGMMIFVCTMMLVCARLHAGRAPAAAAMARRRRSSRQEGTVVVIEQEPVMGGLDEEAIAAYPKFLYSEKEKEKEQKELTRSQDSACSICLGDYTDGESLRLLPDCGHAFHVTCIDAWLRLHISCPICRSSPLPSPLSTPLSELTPLAQNPLASI